MDRHWHGWLTGAYADRMRSLLDPGKILKNAGIERGMTVADLGCGPGFFTIPLAEAVGSNGMVYAVDSNPEILDYLRENIGKARISSGRIKVVLADVSRTGIADNSVDVLFLANVFHDIEDRTAFFEEAKRICKPGAMLVDVDWDRARTARGPPFELRISLDEAEKILNENGFELVKSIEAGKEHYGLVSRLVSK